MISNSFLIDIQNVLGKNKNFSRNDFEVQPENGKLKIRYVWDYTYYFEISIPTQKSKLTRTDKTTTGLGFQTVKTEIDYEEFEFSGNVCPGTIAKEERFSFEGKGKLLKHVSDWLNNLWSELTIEPELRKLKEIEEKIEELNDQLKDAPEDYFTKEEAASLSEKLDKLEEQFRSKLESEILDKEALATTIKELHAEIEKLKGQSKVLNKKNWMKSFGGKIFIWLSKEENRKFLKDGKEFLKPFLPESVDKFI